MIYSDLIEQPLCLLVEVPLSLGYWDLTEMLQYGKGCNCFGVSGRFLA